MRAWLAEAQAGPPGASDCKFTVSSNCRCLQGLEGGEHGEAGDYAASASSSTCISGYHRLNTEPNSPYGFFTGGGNERQKARGLLPRVDRPAGTKRFGTGGAATSCAYLSARRHRASGRRIWPKPNT